MKQTKIAILPLAVHTSDLTTGAASADDLEVHPAPESTRRAWLDLLNALHGKPGLAKELLRAE